MKHRATSARAASRRHGWRRVLIAALLLASAASVGFAGTVDTLNTLGYSNGRATAQAQPITVTQVPPSKYVTDVILAQDPQVPYWFFVNGTTFSSCTFSSSGQTCVNLFVDPASVTVTLNGLVLTSHVAPGETNQTPDYTLVQDSNQLVILLAPGLYTNGARVRVSYHWAGSDTPAPAPAKAK